MSNGVVVMPFSSGDIAAEAGIEEGGQSFRYTGTAYPNQGNSNETLEARVCFTAQLLVLTDPCPTFFFKLFFPAYLLTPRGRAGGGEGRKVKSLLQGYQLP